MDHSYIHRVKRRDRIARWVITLGGLFIIVSVIAIIVMIARVALPLFLPARAELLGMSALPGNLARSLAVGTDEAMETGATLDGQGGFSFFRLRDGAPLGRQQAAPPSPRARRLVGVEDSGQGRYSLLWDDGSLSLERLQFTAKFSAEGKRTIDAKLERVKSFDAVTSLPQPVRALAREASDGSQATRIGLLPDGRFLVTRQTTTTDLLGESTSETKQYVIGDELPGPVSVFTANQAGNTLYAGTRNGYLLRWDLKAPDSATLLGKTQAFADGRAITALALVLGDISLAVGDARGGLSTWFPVSTGRLSGATELRQIHTLASHDGAITTIIPSRRDKSLLSLDAQGHAHLDHMTSERHLAELTTPAPLVLVALAPHANGIIGVDGRGQVAHWSLFNPHPEISWRTLFGKVWYESYPAPAYVWQSSSASDDFEPKLSLAPLIYGTLKGTFYALIFAMPLAILGALYTSQFMRPGLRRSVKPAVEIMAAIPSVVIGFLAALWLAPLVERSLINLFLSLLFLPAALLLALLVWQRLERIRWMRKLSDGHEFLMLLPVLVIGLGLAALAGPWTENHFFNGALVQWMFDDLHVRYDPRNCIIIAFALGFAVIPIIFTIADDALSNIPRSLTAASLALGASRWQTAWRVVLPSASPGIFAGVMIGLGRAVGETMIVLMATGNTPIMDASLLNGMRTLSANIAVEISEAPLGGTLYRILFLTAVLLFLLTFVLNTLAEIVRQRLRKRFGQL